MKTIALCIGHSRPINGHPEGGALSHDDKMQEWTYNLPLAILIRQHLNERGYSAEIISTYEGTSYGSAQRWLAARLKSLAVTLAVELHFNAADSPAATGHEWLYWHSSTKAKSMATLLDQAMRKAVPDLPARGIKPKDSSDRGAEFLRGTHCPAVICEPFFGSSPHDWAIANEHRPAIARAIADGLAAALAASSQG